MRLRDPSGKNPALCLLLAFADAMVPVGDIAAVGCFAAYAGSAMAGMAAGQAVGGALAEFSTDPSLGGPYSTGGVVVPPPGRPHTGSPYPLLPPWQLPPTTYNTDGEWSCVVPTTLPPFLQPPLVRPGPTLLPGEGPLVLQQSAGRPPRYVDRDGQRYETPRAQQIKLGLRDTLANSVPGVTHQRWLLEGLTLYNQSPDFWTSFRFATENATGINFNLDGIEPDSPLFWQHYPQGYTYREIDQILAQPELLAKTTFYRDEHPLSPDETTAFLRW